MKLESVRELKQSIQNDLVSTQRVFLETAPQTQRFAMATAFEPSLTGLKDEMVLSRIGPQMTLSKISPALGVGRRDGTFVLAIRVQDPFASSRSIVEFISERAAGEIDVKSIVGARVHQLDPRIGHRPVPIGVSVSHADVPAGTLGCYVTRGGGVIEGLSMNHVLANSNLGQVGNPILQPGTFDGGTVTKDRVASLSHFVPLTADEANRVDVALCVFDSSVEPLTPNPPLGVSDPENIVEVAKFGRTTSFTEGTITTLELDGVVLDVPNLGPVEFDGLIEVESESGPFSMPGDSGALVTDRTTKLGVGLLLGGPGGPVSWAIPLTTTLQELGASLVQF